MLSSLLMVRIVGRLHNGDSISRARLTKHREVEQSADRTVCEQASVNRAAHGDEPTRIQAVAAVQDEAGRV